jgi:drug/metabolite transporter (DMT)-like permease
MAVVYVNIPSFFIFLIIYLVNFIRNKLRHGYYWSKDISIFFKEEDNSIDWFIILGVVLMSTCKFIAFCFVVLTFNYAIAAGINLGIITVIFNFCCITDSIIFYIFFNEKLSKGQLIGSIILLTSAYFISQKPDKAHTLNVNEPHLI